MKQKSIKAPRKHLMVVLLFLVFGGCSSTYRLNDFPSKEKFCESFNNSAKDKSLKVVLKNDSIITAEFGAEISNDSLIINKFVTKEQTIRRDEIKDIEYGTFNTTMRLKNGKSIEIKSNKMSSDSLFIVLYDENVPEYLPLDNVYSIRYKDHWAGVPAGIGWGIPSGFAFGVLIGNIYFQPSGQGVDASQSASFIGLFSALTVGWISGGITGYIIGRTYIYKFTTEIGSAP